jgi:hypothetical protein
VTDKILVSPFIVKSQDQKESVSYPAEIASAVCLTEFQRRKTGFLRDTAEKTEFLSKLHYPLWLVPFEDSCLIIDGLATSTHNCTFKEPANTGLFVEELKKHSAIPQEFTVALSTQAKNAEKIAATVNVPLKALIADKELLKFFPDYLKSSVVFSSDKMVFVPSGIDEGTAVAARDAVSNCLRRIEANAKGLQYALEVLTEEVEFHKRMLLTEVELLKAKCEAEAESLKPEVERNIEQLKSKQDTAAAKVLKDTEKKAAALEKKHEKYMRKLQGLGQRKEARGKRSASRRAYQSYTLEKYDREISDAKKEIRANDSLIDEARKEGSKSVKKLEEEFCSAAALEEAKIKKLNSAYEAKIGERKKQSAAMASETAAITKSFTSLIDEIKRAASVFKEQIAVNWKLDTPTLVCVPVYVAGYVKDSEERYNLFSPVTISEDAGVLQGLRKILTLTSEPRLKRLMRPASNELQELLSASVIKRMQNAETFKQNITSLCRVNNLLERDDFERTLSEGLTEAEQKRWLTAEEAEAVHSGIRGEAT